MKKIKYTVDVLKLCFVYKVCMFKICIYFDFKKHATVCLKVFSKDNTSSYIIVYLPATCTKCLNVSFTSGKQAAFFLF